MAGATTNFAWPFPTNGDPANVAPDDQTMLSAVDGTLGNAGTVYAPIWTAVTTPPNLGTGVLAGRFHRFAKWGWFSINLTPDGSTTFGTGAWRFTLPVGWQMLSLNTLAGHAWAFDTSLTTTAVGEMVPVALGPPTTIEFRGHGSTAAASGTVPFAWATTDHLYVTGVVELA